MKNKIILATFFLSIMYTPGLLGEATREVDKANAVPVVPNAGDNQAAQGEANGLMADVNQIKRDADVAPLDQNTQLNRDGGKADRKDKADGARNTGKLGTGVAIATGIALDARGSALELPAPGVAAALHAMAALEYAQAIVDAASASDNDSQSKMLEKPEALSTNGGREDGGATRFNNNKTAQDKAAQLNTPEMDDYLKKNGVDVNDFKEKLASGAYRNVDEVLEGMGMGGKVSEYDMKQAERIAETTIREESRSGSSQASNASISGMEGASVSGVSVSGGASSRDLSSLSQTGNSSIQSVSREGRFNSGHSGEGSNTLATGGTMSDFLKKFSSENKPGMLDRKLTDYEIQLEKANIFPATGRMQIFQIAHRNYREYGKWRRNTKLAIR